MQNNLTTHKVLITGITGFVGPFLARHLLDAGHEVSGLILRRADGNRPRRLNEMNIISNINLIYGDITDLTSYSISNSRYSARLDISFGISIICTSELQRSVRNF